MYKIESASFFQWVIQSFNFFTDFSLFWSLGRKKGSINLQPSNMHFKLFKHIAWLLHIGFESRLKAQLYSTSNNRINDRDSYLVEFSSPDSIQRETDLSDLLWVPLLASAENDKNVGEHLCSQNGCDEGVLR